MPSRKSDVRRSDVSAVSRPADDEDSPMTAAPAQTEDNTTPATESLAAAPPEEAASSSSSEPPQGPAESSNAGTTTASEKGKEKDKERERREDAITIEDLNLPKSIITRLAKGVLPPNTQIQANAILALSKSATVFISHLSNAANEWTMSGGKKTIMPADVFRALDDIEYGFMREKLEAEFAKFNEVQSTKRSAYRKKVSAAKRAAKGGLGGDGSVADSSVMSAGTTAGAADESMLADTTMGTSADGGADGGGARAAKKARVDTAGDGKMDVDGEGEGEVSDADTVPDEHVDEEDDDDDEEEEEDEDDEEEEEDGGPGEDDEVEERPGREVEDEALDEDSE